MVGGLRAWRSVTVPCAGLVPQKDRRLEEEAMTNKLLTRRALLCSTAAMAGLAGSGISLSALAQSEVRLRMFWWGAKERADRTERANQLFQKKNPGVTITGETLGWGDYWPRVATQVAGRNAADVLQMDYRYIFEYARRGALLPLDEFMPATLNLGDFSKFSIDSGKVDGKLYGVAFGLNSVAMIYDKEFIQSLGLKEPRWDMGWAELGDLAVEITKTAKRPGYFGMPDAGRYEPALDVWVRQRGKVPEVLLGCRDADPYRQRHNIHAVADRVFERLNDHRSARRIVHSRRSKNFVVPQKCLGRDPADGGERRGDALARCDQVIAEKLPKVEAGLGRDWRDWIIAHALQSEAKQMIDGGASPTSHQP